VSAQFDLVTFDTPDTEGLAAFWCAAMHLHITEHEDSSRWLVLSDAAGIRRLGLQRGVARPGGVHLDLVCAADEFSGEVDRLVGLGARLVSPVRAEPYGAIANMSDPDGNAFDLCAYA
jgi:predicted enzyme related to lactoylglutathione lyase